VLLTVWISRSVWLIAHACAWTIGETSSINLCAMPRPAPGGAHRRRYQVNYRRGPAQKLRRALCIRPTAPSACALRDMRSPNRGMADALRAATSPMSRACALETPTFGRCALLALIEFIASTNASTGAAICCADEAISVTCSPVPSTAERISLRGCLCGRSAP
jgi:hypothetical protein